MNAIGNI